MDAVSAHTGDKSPELIVDSTALGGIQDSPKASAGEKTPILIPICNGFSLQT
jgi:hypothetical protein